MNGRIDDERAIGRAEGNLASKMDGDTVMMSIANGKYYNLGQVGGRIWELIEQPLTIGEIVGTLTEEYEIDAALCELQVRTFLANLAEEGLVVNG